MDENQRQDWWPDNHPDDFTRTSGQTNQPDDLPPNTDTDNAKINPGDPYNQYSNPQQDSNSGDSYNRYSNPQQDSNSGDSYNWSSNPYNNSSGNAGNTNNQPGGYYSNYPPRRSSGGPMVTAALVMGILSLVLMCCGLSYVFGALGIIFALLSRKDGPMDSQAKIGLGLSIAGSVIGIAIVIFALTSNFSQYTNMFKEYQDFYSDYYNSKHSDFDDFNLDNFDWDNYNSKGYDFNPDGYDSDLDGYDSNPDSYNSNPDGYNSNPDNYDYYGSPRYDYHHGHHGSRHCTHP